MKILSTYSMPNYRNTSFQTREIKPVFKSEVSKEPKSNISKKFDNNKDLLSGGGLIIASIAAIWTFVRGHRAKINLKNKNKTLTKEKSNIDKNIEKSKQRVEELKKRNNDLSKEIEALRNQSTQPVVTNTTSEQSTQIVSETPKAIKNSQKQQEQNIAKPEKTIIESSSNVVIKTEPKPSEKAERPMDEFEKKVKDFQENFPKKVKALENAMEGLEGIKAKVDTETLLTKINDMKGFGRIQGYAETKKFFNQKYIEPLRNKNYKLIPNIILMYGPQGTGKTLFAEELAYEARCNRIKIDLGRDEKQNLAELKNSLAKATKIFEKAGQKSLIQIEEIDILSFKDEKLKSEFSNILNKLSEKYHSTIIATTNYPNLIDKNILDTQKLEMLYIAPPSKGDIAQILKFVCQYISEPNVNYEELAEQILNKAGNDFYSSARIYTFVKNVAKQHQSFTTKLTQQDIAKYIEKDLANADISAQNLAKEYKAYTNTQTEIEPEKDEFVEKVTKATNDLKQKIIQLEQDMKGVQGIKDKTDLSELLARLNNIKGFERIKGYNKIKEFFNLKLIDPIKNNKNDIPNAILMYGPQGTGKTLFAEGLAYETGAKYVEMGISRNELRNLQSLSEIAVNAKQNFEKTGKRTLIQIDEIDSLIIENNDVKEKFIKLLNSLSNNYYATIVATTNNPKDLDKTILQIPNFEKLYVPPAKKQDIAEILQYIGKYIGEPDVDYIKLADLVLAKAGENAYSSARIYKFITSVISKQKSLSNKLSQKDFETIITKDLFPPDINKKDIECYQGVF